ncbi:MAG: 3-phosphoserine/phosphohydroxythreonine transaminase [Christensenellales bacterium]|nr:3-phosphoserine/phosphohydroxythreonine transaminase [Christensenellales bacterium]
MKRVYNFAAGPSTMPTEALETAAREMLCYGDTGMSVMEMSHRSKMYLEIFNETEALLRELMHIPENYAVLLMQGGATGQFAGIPMNLLSRSADYIDSGNFAHGALVEAKKFGDIRCVASSREEGYVQIPQWNTADFNPDADYFYITTNNTIFGTRYATLPETGNVPLVADMSSNILSEVYDVSRFGVIFAGAQKNIGPAGLTLVIVRRDLLGRARKDCPKILNWSVMDENGSMPNTPSTYAIYMAGLCMKWLKKQGGVEGIEKINIEKANLLYDLLDESKFYRPRAKKEFRSRMNVAFTTPDADLDAKFLKEAAAVGLVNLKGHRVTGGIRASIYNAMPVEGVQALREFMKKFEQENR